MIDLDRLRERLSAVRLTPNAASEAAGLGRSYVRDILRGRIKAPSASRLLLLSETLKTTPSYLLGGSEEDSWFSSPDADDRSPRRAKEALATTRAALRRGEIPTNRQLFDMLDSVTEYILVFYIYQIAAGNIYTDIGTSGKLSLSDLQLLCGDAIDTSYEPYMRRMLTAKLIGLIDQDLFDRAVLLSELLSHAREVGQSFDIADSKSEAILAPAMDRDNFARFTREGARVFVMNILMRFISVGVPEEELEAMDIDHPAKIR